MNKKEIIKDIQAIIDNRCEAELSQVHAESKGGKVTKTVSTSLIAKDIYNASYRKVIDDEIIIKEYEYARLKNLEINYELVYEDYRKLETTNKRLEQEVKSLESGLELLQQKYEELGVEIAKHSCVEHSPNEPTKCVIDYITIPFQRLAIPRLHFSEWQSYEE